MIQLSLSPPVEESARFDPVVSHPPPSRDHPDEDIWQGMLRVLAQPAKSVQETLGPTILLPDRRSGYPAPPGSRLAPD